MINRNFTLACAATALAAVAVANAQPQNQYLGRWNLNGTGENSNYVFWLEL